MLKYKAAYKYKIPYKGLYEIAQMWTNDTITLQMGTTTVRYKTHHINPYKNKNDAEDVDM